jgi:hypothetical protein
MDERDNPPEKEIKQRPHAKCSLATKACPKTSLCRAFLWDLAQPDFDG